MVKEIDVVSIVFALSINDVAMEHRDSGYTMIMGSDKVSLEVPIIISNDRPFEDIREELHKAIDKAFDAYVKEAQKDE